MKKIFVDGSCFGNDLKKETKGGFGIYVSDGLEFFGYTNYGTTNNQMEIISLIFALAYSKDNDEAATIYSDSAYVVNSYNQWIEGWYKKGWKKADGSDVLNSNLFSILLQLKRSLPKIQLKQIAREMNAKADKLARIGSEKAKQTEKNDSEKVFVSFSKDTLREFEISELQSIIRDYKF